VIERNKTSNNGGGIGIYGAMAPEVVGNAIRSNWTVNGDGGGIWIHVFTGGGGVVIDNRIEKNYAADHGGGIYAGLNGSGALQIEISHNVIWDNRADRLDGPSADTGGGLWLFKTDAHVFNNTIARNEGNGPDSLYGGGVLIADIGTPIIERNIIAFTTNGGGIFCNGGTPLIRNNLAWSNVGGHGVGCVNWALENGNIIADPDFCDLEKGNLSLRAGSPALTHPAGILGAIAASGCQPLNQRRHTWFDKSKGGSGSQRHTAGGI
jgi:predicted outer membrane repeat protein